MPITQFQESIDSDIRILRQAHKENAPVLLDLVMSIGEHGLSSEKRSRKESEYYRVIPIDSIRRYLKIRKELISIGDSAFFDSIMVGYKKQKLSHELFDLNNDIEKAKELYGNLKSGKEAAKVKPTESALLAMGFPRFLVFKRTHDAT